MTFLSGLILFIAAVLGGALNSVAGGGSFITFPSLIFSGVPPIQANATSTVALWPGSLASVGAYRKEIAKQRLIPYLLLLATVLFAFSPLITARLRKQEATTKETHISWLRLAGISLLQLIIAIYGGYFGGGIGIMMLASLGIMGMENIHEMNGMKTVLQSCINGVAVITFIIAGAVFWLQAIVMILGAIVGGFSGASLARRLDQRIVRGFVILVGTAMTIYFFVK